MTKVFNFSTGESSAMMTILGKPSVNDIVLFCDTEREHEQSYQFLNDFERYEGIKVHRTTYEKKTAEGVTGFDALLANRTDVPNIMHRECTKVLKVKQARRYLKSIGVTKYESFIGYRADEQSRILDYKERFDGVTTRFLLNEFGCIKKDVNDFWLNKPYRLNIPPILKNCDLCFLKGKNAIIRILSVYPELADKWIKDEKKHTYIKGISYKQMLDIAKNQKTLFDLDDILPAFSCACNN